MFNDEMILTLEILRKQSKLMRHHSYIYSWSLVYRLDKIQKVMGRSRNNDAVTFKIIMMMDDMYRSVYID